MSNNLVEEIAAKAAVLPIEKQREALAFVESLVTRKQEADKQPFESVKGILKGNYDTLEQDIAEMRREAWKNFPRDVEL